MRHARTPKFQLSGPTVHSLYCDGMKIEQSHSTVSPLNSFFLNVSAHSREAGPKQEHVHFIFHTQFVSAVKA